MRDIFLIFRLCKKLKIMGKGSENGFSNVAKKIDLEKQNNQRPKMGKLNRLCTYVLIILTILFGALTVLFGVLYYKLIRSDPNLLPPSNWQPVSNSLLGIYTTAAVAADNELCSNIGRGILLEGGNAVDAAIATLFCIGITDTHSAGLGGGHFMTIYNATTQRCHVVDAREVAPSAATEDMYKDRWNHSRFGWEAVAVPGELHGLWTEYKNFGGKVPWEFLVQPAIQLLEEGYPTSEALASGLKKYEKYVLADHMMRKHFVNPETGKIFKAGEQIKTRKDLAETLKELANAKDPAHLFYQGKLAEKFVDEFIKNEDFANYTSIVRPDSEIIYTKLSNGRHICGPPPPSGSAVTQAILNILDHVNMDLSTFDGTVDFFHNFIEASKFSYAARSALGDMAFVPNAFELAKNITSEKWAEDVRAKMTSQTHIDAYYGGAFEEMVDDHGTSSVTVIDRWGNAVSVTSTIDITLGAFVMSESTGILWNNEMDDFSSPGHPNYFHFPPSPANFIRPGKRPMSSMSPLIIFNILNKNEVMAIGGSGGNTIISGVAGVALHTLWHNLNLKQAIDYPRMHNQLRPNETLFEAHTWPNQFIDALKERGQTFNNKFDKLTVITAVGRVANGSVYANSDWRKGYESEPAGY